MKANKKIKLFTIIIFSLGALLLANVLLLDLAGRNFFSKKEFKSLVGVSITQETVYPERGQILDNEGNVLAQDITVYKVYFILNEDRTKFALDEATGNIIEVPDYVTDKRYTANKVAEIIGADANYIYDRLSLEGLYQVEIGESGKNLSYDEKLQIEALELPGVYFESSTTRYYPYKTFASHLLGYVENQQQEDGSYQLVGISGIEGILNDELTGTNGYNEYYSDVYGTSIPGGQIESTSSKNGYNVTLTLNNVIQTAVEECLSKIMKLNDHVEKTWAVVMDGKSGAILGYGSYPSFDANTMEISNYNDFVATLPYEPGSTFKTIVYSAAIDVGTFNKTDHLDATIFYVGSDENGKIKRVSYYEAPDMGIHNFIDEQIPDATFYEAYACSYNVGCAVLLEKYIDQDVFIDYVKAYRFLEPVNVYGIDEGSFYGYADWDSNYAIVATSFGQGISVNALQMMRAYSVFSNGGVMIQPYIIKSITDPETGDVLYEGKREELGRVLQESSVAPMLDLMDGVVNSGWSITSAKYKIDGVTVGGKSGTAEVALPTGGYGDLTIHSIMLGMPIEDPQVYIYVAYQDWNKGTAEYMSLVNQLERTVASALGLTGTTSTTETGNGKTIIYDLDNYVNHTIAYVKPKIEENDLVAIILGDGDTVVRQYPEPGSTLISKEKVMLLTSQENILMPNMIGWSRKDVTAFWFLTGIQIQFDGYGYVTSQSIEEGTVLDKSMTIEVKFN